MCPFDKVLHISLWLGDVPGGTLAGTGTRSRENRCTQDTKNSDARLESFGNGQVINLRDALCRIICSWVILIGLIARGSTRQYRRDLNQVDQVLRFGFLVSLITSKNARTRGVHLLKDS